MKVINGLEIEECLYEGKNSLVYLAKNVQNGEKSLIKLLKDSHPVPELVQQLETEYNVNSGINSIYVRKPRSFSKNTNNLYLEFEYFEGKTIRQYISENKFSYSQFLNLSIQIAQGLGDIHSSKIIHKDINNNNILINRSGKEIRIIDFGISTFWM